MLTCNVVPAEHEIVIQILTAVGLFNYFFYAYNSGRDLITIALEYVRMSKYAQYVYILLGLVGLFLLICRVAGVSQKCKLKSIPGKALVPIVKDASGKPAIISTTAVKAAKEAKHVAKKAAHHAKVAAKAAVSNPSATTKAAAHEAAKHAVLATQAAKAADTHALTPLSLQSGSLGYSAF